MAGLGPRRVLALVLTGLTVFLLVGASGYLLSRPLQEILYSGLDPQDVTRMGEALHDAGIGFDVNVAGDAVLVATGQAANARMLLAQKGLPRSDTAGYELFDKLGSLGLTTFMQQVTKVRALEGELAKTIRLLEGIKGARVHLALKSEGSFRSNSDLATASVVIKADGDAAQRSASAIRYLVAAAIPGLSPAEVTVLSADGTLLASSDDAVSAAPERLLGLERSIAAATETRVSRTLIPFMGLDNFRVSVNAKLNTDRRQISETTFDPNSRVERSVRTIKESGEAQNAQTSGGVTVEQNIPVEQAATPTGDKSSEKKDKKEELTNYEINSRSVSTISEGYVIDRLSIALVINKAILLKSLGGSPTSTEIDGRISELKRLAASAGGLSEERGDSITVTAVDFVEQDVSAPLEGESITSWLGDHVGIFMNAGTLILSVLLIVMLGLRPAVRAIVASDPVALTPPSSSSLPSIGIDPAGMPAADMAVSSAALDNFALPQLGSDISDVMLDNLVKEVGSSPKDRLVKIVELDPERAAEVLKRWLDEPVGRSA